MELDTQTEEAVKSLFNTYSCDFNYPTPSLNTAKGRRRPTTQRTQRIEELIKMEVRKVVVPLQKEVRTLKTEMAALKHKLETTTADKQELEKAKDDIVKLECYSRKDNLKFFGFREVGYETKFDCKRKILQTLQDSNINLHPKALESVHRLGPKQHNRSRPIIVKFFHAEEKSLVFSKAQHIWSTTNIRIEEDFASKIEANRKVLKPILLAANKMVDQNGKREYQASMRLDKLNINGKVYTVDNVNKVPEKLTLGKLSTQTQNNITAFFTKDSPFSNHHLVKQEIEHTSYNCNEQYYMCQKALTFKDQKSADAIMNETDPGKQKGLGRDINITNFNQTTWNDKCREVMKNGLKAKFSQNENMKRLLLETGTNEILEANPRDSYWGVGLSLKDRRIWKSHSWWGNANNHLGILLVELRRELKAETTLT